MRKHFYLLLTIIVTLNACQTETWYKTQSGLRYRVFSGGNRDSARITNTIKYQIIEKAGDSIISNSYNRMPVYTNVMPAFINGFYVPSETFFGLCTGDSVLIVRTTDSLIAKHMLKERPKWLRPTDEWVATVKVLGVFKSDSLLNVDKEIETKKLKAKLKAISMERLKKWLKTKNIAAQNHNDSAYVQVVSPGEDTKIDTGASVTLDFNIRTTRGKLINSTTDTSFHHAVPQTIIQGNHMMPLVIEEAIKGLGKAGHVVVYIPTVLLFGIEDYPEQIKPGDDLIADIEIRDVKKR